MGLCAQSWVNAASSFHREGRGWGLQHRESSFKVSPRLPCFGLGFGRSDPGVPIAGGARGRRLHWAAFCPRRNLSWSENEGSLAALGILVRNLQWNERALALWGFQERIAFRSFLVGLMDPLKIHC